MNPNFIEVTCLEKTKRKTIPIELIEEEPLSIRVEGKPYLLVMRTPGNEKELATGICLAEGIIDSLEDITSIGLCDDSDRNVITITLTESRRRSISDIFKRKSYISNSSCGICGKEMVTDISNTLNPIKNNTQIEAKTLISNILRMTNHQPLRKKTRAAHCSIIYDNKSILLSSAEDVGRHNALDKSIGRLILEDTLKDGYLITLSSRISYELVLKAAKARIPIISAISRPTSLALDLATKLNITLVTLSHYNGLLVYCNKHRLIN